MTDGAHWLGAWADGWDLRPTPGSDSSDVKPGATVDFVARAMIDVPTTVLMPDGSPPAE